MLSTTSTFGLDDMYLSFLQNTFVLFLIKKESVFINAQKTLQTRNYMKLTWSLRQKALGLAESKSGVLCAAK